MKWKDNVWLHHDQNARYLIFEFLNVPHLPGKMLSAPIAQPDGHKTEDYHNPQMDVV